MRPRLCQLERYFARYEFRAAHLLCCSDCESWSIDEILELEPSARESLLSLRLGYTQSQGSPELRAEIAGLYHNLDAEQILVHAGAEEAIFNFMNVTVQAGDHVVVHAPYYQSLAEVARAIGATVSEWRGDPSHGWELSLQALVELLSDRTRLVVVNFPHNPTGFLPTDEFLLALSELADSRGFLVFSDEVYRGLEYQPNAQLQAFADLNERAVSLGVMSKSYGLAGLRIGWTATQNESIQRELAAFKDYTTICSSAPSEFLAAIALRHRATILDRNLEIVSGNLKELDVFFRQHPHLFQWVRPRAGPIAFPRYRKGSVVGLCRDLRQRVGVLLLPGSVYGDYDDRFRIGFGRKDMPIALQKFEDLITSRA